MFEGYGIFMDFLMKGKEKSIRFYFINRFLKLKKYKEMEL